MQNDHAIFNLEDASQGIARDLAPGLSVRIFVGDNAMLSIVTIAPNAIGAVHSHPEEPWGVPLEGSAVRIQGDKEVAVKARDFWRTPGGVLHGIRAGAMGALACFGPHVRVITRLASWSTSS
jgi:quercetin dioxygenase-like cupin family protein